MSTNGTTITSSDTATDTSLAAGPAPEQLTLLAPTAVPLQFRLDERTRRSGLAHVAALRAQMVAQAASRNLSSNPTNGSAGDRRVVERSTNRRMAA